MKFWTLYDIIRQKKERGYKEKTLAGATLIAYQQLDWRASQ